MSPEYTKTLGTVISAVEKSFGKGAIMHLNADVKVEPDNVTSTGSIALDSALGIGGYKKGRIVEIYGPESSGKTTLMLHAIAEVQKTGGICAFIDAEHALDPLYASNIGVDLDQLLVSQPDCGEQALQIAAMLARSGEVRMIVIDSVAALTPQKEIEGDVGDHHVGSQARLMSQGLRMLTGAVNTSGCVVLFTNQIRMKIGVMFGCFHYDARVLLADGTTEKIGKIVNNKMPVKVLCKNKDGKLEAKEIIDWHNNGKAERFYNLVVDYPHGSGKSYLPIGDDHNIFTPNGEKLASELKIGDEVLVKSKKYLGKDQLELAIGTFLGDGSIRVNDAENTAVLRLGHGLKQALYLKYKANFLGSSFMNECYNIGTSAFGCDSKPTNELVWLSKYKSGKSIRYIDYNLATQITLRSLAIWYLDDGTFSGSYSKWGWGKSEIAAKNLDYDSAQIFIRHCTNSLGISAPTFIEGKGFLFSGKRNESFQKAIAKYVPRCMDYKLHPKLRYLCDGTNEIFKEGNQVRDILIPAKITDIYEKPESKKTNKFDITVEGNHNYFIDNVLVHNSPETTTGGNALKFYASQRLDIRRIGSIKSKTTDEHPTGIRAKVKVVKNKLAPPFREAEFDIRFGVGIDSFGEIVDLGVDDEIIEKSGSWYSYKDQRIGQGRENSIQFMKENPTIAEEIKQKILDLRGLGLTDDVPKEREEKQED